MSQNICNICGANYEYRNGRWKCPACGAYKVEELSPEEATLFNVAAQKLRFCDFDEAEKAYTDIIEKYPQNPNGYWGRLLSRYGIKYEEDFDGRKIPTCYATSIESVISDKDFIKAIEFADNDTKVYFERQAQYIERVRKEWVERARKEKPYDIFICYKDSDLANGVDRTQDSIAAQELYIHLTEQGYRVFFSRESLRGKVGEKYEPYIFNALSTAKVMLVYGSKSEYITSTWLKNEWTRYEKRLQAGEKKSNSLIVACDGFSPNELPKVLSSMQCFDATSRSFYTDLDAVLKKIIKGEEKPKPVVEPKPKKKKSKALPITIAAISVVIAIVMCILLPNLLGDKSIATITDSKYGVVITADSEIFDNNTSVIVDKLTDGAQYTALISTVNNSKSVEIENAIIYDIECDADITKNVTIKVAYSKSSTDATVKVYYVSDDKSLIEEHSCIYDDGFVEFKTNHLSYYVIGEIVTTSNPGGNENPPATPSLTYEEGVLQVGVSANYEPYEYLDDGQFKGIEIDILKAIAAELGLEIRFENDTFEDLLGNLNAKEVDCIIGVTETAQRNELATASKVMFSEEDAEYIIYVNKDCTELLQAINNAIDKLNSNNTIDGIIDRYEHPETGVAHTATFKIDEQVIATRTFYEGDSVLDLPTIPARQCYVGAWESYTLGTTDITINGYYTAQHENLAHRPASEQNDCSLVDNIEHWYCSVCNKYYLDKNATSETTEVYIPAGCNFVDGACTRCEGTEGIIYSNNQDGTYSVNSLDSSCTAKHIVIPAKYDGKPVTTIDSCAFLNSSIESITFKGTITEIGSSAFQWCNSLESISLSSCSLTIINEQTFYECENLETIELPNSIVTIGKSAFNGSTKIKYINIPSSVQTIEYGAFMNCTGLLTVSIPNNVQTVEDCAFCGCTALTTVSIGNKVETIGESAFSDCDKLTTIAFGSKVSTIDDSAFARCVELKSVQLPNSVTTLGKHVFLACGNLESINIPNSVTAVGESCFSSCSKATITCDFEAKPSGWNTKWNENGGNVVWALAKVQFLFHYEYAEGNNSQNVAAVTVGEIYTLPVPTRTGYTFVGWFSEAGGNGTKYTDSSGKAVTAFSNNVVPICNAYAYWEGSSCVTYSGGTTYYVVYEYDWYDWYETGEPIYIPEYYNGLPVTGINSQAFKNYSGTVVLPKSLKTIASGAFSEHHMDYIVIPEGVTTINVNAFKYTDNPAGSHTFTIFYEGSEIPAGWDEGWNKYTWVTGNGFVTTHTGYTTVYVKGQWHYENGIPTPNSASTKLTLCFDANGGEGSMEVVYLDSNHSITLPQNEYSRNGYTFKGWSTTSSGSVVYEDQSLYAIAESATILYAVWEESNYTVKLITNGGSVAQDTETYKYNEIISLPTPTREGNTFGGWFVDKNLTIAFSNEKMPAENLVVYAYWLEETKPIEFTTGYNDFLYDEQLLITKFVGNSTIVNVPMYIGGEMVRVINFQAFKDSSVVEVNLPQSIRIIESEAFQNCAALKKISIPNSIEYIYPGVFDNSDNLEYTEEYNILYLGNADNPFVFLAKAKTKLISECKINPNTRIIGGYAFQNCKNIKTVIIPDSVICLTQDAFSDCSGLESVVFGNGLENTGYSTFSNCTKLSSVTLGANIKEIRGHTFYKCSALSEIVIPEGVEIIRYYVFEYSGIRRIVLPKSIKTIERDVLLYASKFEVVYYAGTEADWNKINNVGMSDVTVYFYSETLPDEYAEYYWHYVDGNITMWSSTSATQYSTGLLYQDNGDGTYSVAGIGECTDTVIVIPPTYNGKSVTKIQNSAFKWNETITTVIIPDGVTFVGSESFYDSSIINIVIPKSVTVIQYDAFAFASDLHYVFYQGTEEEWNNVTVGTWNTELLNATICFYSETYKSGGNYWRYVDGIPTEW